MSFVVAIDGPAGTGKGTITALISKEMGLVNIDTGATYRCVALYAIRNNIKLQELQFNYKFCCRNNTAEWRLL